MKFLSVISAAIAVSMICGCSSVKNTSDNTVELNKFSAGDVQQGLQLSEKYISALIEAVNKKDFNIISPFLGADILSLRQKKSVFQEMCKRFSLNGKIVSHSLLTVADQTLCRDYIWKIDFQKTTASDKIPVLKTSMLYSIRIIMSGKKPEIVRARPIQL